MSLPQLQANNLKLPQELLDEIIALASSADLNNCSLVARSFRRASQKRLFCSLRFSVCRTTNDEVFEQLVQIYAGSPELALHTRSLTLDDIDWDMETDASDPYRGTRACQQLLALIPQLVNVTELTISVEGSAAWGTYPVELRTVLQESIRLPNLTKLRLSDARFATGAELVSLIAGRPTLTTLDFVNILIEDPDISDGDLQHSQDLTRLYLMPSYFGLITALERVVNWASLRHFFISILGLARRLRETLQRILDAAHSLDCLQICFHSWTCFADLHLHNLRALRQLDLSVTFHSHTDPDGSEIDSLISIAALISTTPSPSPLEYVVLIFSSPVLENLPDLLAQSKIEAELISDRMSRLRSVTLRFLPGSQGISIGDLSEERLDKYRQVFPVLHKRGILQIAIP
ncbi:hypothetical protein C8F01DRAFT_1181116 [Mycena amicta]|nr:hypothetical protein C8F01DRAFT_1181116 [Mycena amicta]